MEVVQSHQFLERWISGSIEKTEQEFQRFRNRVADDFTIIYPDGQLKDKKALMSDIWDSHRARPQQFSIEIRNYECRVDLHDLCVVTYEEWLHSGRSKGRMSTAVFRLSKQKVEWVLVHETWLPK